MLRRETSLTLGAVAIVGLGVLMGAITLNDRARVHSVHARYDTVATNLLARDIYSLLLAVRYGGISTARDQTVMLRQYERTLEGLGDLDVSALSPDLVRFHRHIEQDVRRLEPTLTDPEWTSSSTEIFERLNHIAADMLQFASMFGDEANDAIAETEARLENSLIAMGVLICFFVAFCLLLTRRILVQNRKLEDAVRTDFLTGIRNRYALQHDLEMTVGKQDCAAVLLDLDGFKSVNDRLGHNAGDTLLRVVADRMQLCCAPGETAYRIGGDEFAVIIEGKEARLRGMRYCERFLSAIANPVRVGRTKLRVTASLGVSELAADSRDSVDQLMGRADKALYRAKGCGKACYRVDGEDERLTQRDVMEAIDAIDAPHPHPQTAKAVA
ncbi:GGDEF domain-containing protein [Fulvimarina sp. 2208YS6-2-32]|uniref:GGDEF domain-containing protein n=1 Tax=Fulvimarina uroteuthidis TaxID=3098149 RepID=UPI002AC9ABF4|nr:GGDEF domain-containing protein [Fulvimarina sp. 2208YS6-2-32]